MLLKGLKKDSKKQTKKDTPKEKQPKNEIKKPSQQQEEDMNANLVQINYDQKQATIKTIKKVPNSKLQEKQIDTSNIIIQKKQEKKVIKSWVVQEADIKNVLTQDFKLNQHLTDFWSLTNQQINKQLAEKAKKESQTQIKSKVIQQGGIKFAPLQNNQTRKQPQLFINKKVENTSFISNIPIQPKQIPTFINSNPSNGLKFAPLQINNQQTKVQQLESKKRKEPELVLKGKSTAGWIGTKFGDKKPQVTPPQEFKLSQWATQASDINDAPKINFAPIQNNEQKFNRKEQEFKFTSKKQQQQRKKAKGQEVAKLPIKQSVNVNIF